MILVDFGVPSQAEPSVRRELEPICCPEAEAEQMSTDIVHLLVEVIMLLSHTVFNARDSAPLILASRRDAHSFAPLLEASGGGKNVIDHPLGLLRESAQKTTTLPRIGCAEKRNAVPSSGPSQTLVNTYASVV